MRTTYVPNTTNGTVQYLYFWESKQRTNRFLRRLGDVTTLLKAAPKQTNKKIVKILIAFSSLKSELWGYKLYNVDVMHISKSSNYNKTAQ